MIHEYYKQLKVGDEVQCTPEPQPNPNDDSSPGGYGYSPNLKFKIKSIDKYNNYIIFFKEGGGVYHNSIVIPKELNYEIY